MISGILQRLTIIEFTDIRLVLRELPLLEWLLAGILWIAAINFVLFGLWATAVASLLLGGYFVLQAHIRTIIFDADTNLMTVENMTLFNREIVSVKELHEISRAYLEKDDDGNTQIMLVDVVGDEMGLSVYSRDMRPWKEDIVVAINTVLHQAHKDDPDPDAVI
jgi:hypothetical protein